MRWVLLAAALLAGCSGVKIHQECNQICKDHGLRFVGIERGTTGYDAVERETQSKDVCRCE